MSLRSRVAIFGGTFDPVHWGHVLIARTALDSQGLERVLWVPTRDPPYKKASPCLKLEQRAFMIQLAIADCPQFELFWHEGERGATDYAMTTFEHVQSFYPNCQWYWIIGLDAFTRLPRWYGREQLIPAVRWLVAPRLVWPRLPTPLPEGSDRSAWLTAYSERVYQQVIEQLHAQNIAIRSQLLSLPLVDISSSTIRHYCRQSRSIAYLVPEAVRIYIEKHHLYRD